ncbi:MAG: permease [Rhodospirillales bacterium]|nr:permease [Rhodospirillales bacterium]
MVTTSIVLWLLAIGLGVYAYTKPGDLHREGLKIAKAQLIKILPRVLMAVMTAGFLGAILPGEMVSSWLGKESGLQGIIIASVVGGFIPGGPVLSFPFVVALMKTGAGVPQMAALLAGWSVFALHRVMAFEIPLMGWRFTALRFSSSLLLPPLSGILAGLIMSAGMV